MSPTVSKLSCFRSLFGLCLLLSFVFTHAADIDLIFECDFDSGDSCGAQYQSDLDDLMTVVPTSQVIEPSSSIYTITDVSSIIKPTLNNHQCQIPFSLQGIQYDHCTDSNECEIGNGSVDKCADGRFLSAKIQTPYEDQENWAIFPLINVPEDGEYHVEYFVFIYCDQLDQDQCRQESDDFIEVKLVNNGREEPQVFLDKNRSWTPINYSLQLSKGTLEITVRFIRPSQLKQSIVQFGFDNLRVYKDKIITTTTNSYESTSLDDVSSSSAEPSGSTLTTEYPDLSESSTTNGRPTSYSTETSGNSASSTTVEPISFSTETSENSVISTTGGTDPSIGSTTENSDQPTSYSTEASGNSVSSSTGGSEGPTSYSTGSSEKPESSSTGHSSVTTISGSPQTKSTPISTTNTPATTTTTTINPELSTTTTASSETSKKVDNSANIVLIVTLATIAPLGVLTAILVISIVYSQKRRSPSPDTFNLN